MEIMPHADMRTTLKHYLDLRLHDLSGAIDALPAVEGSAEAAEPETPGTEAELRLTGPGCCAQRGAQQHRREKRTFGRTRAR
jgi:hypothetical protein